MKLTMLAGADRHKHRVMGKKKCTVMLSCLQGTNNNNNKTTNARVLRLYFIKWAFNYENCDE